MRTAPWPHYDQQHEARLQATRISWWEPESVCPMAKDHYPDGCYMLSYPGGGLHAIYLPSEREEFMRDCAESIDNPAPFWSRIAGRDINAKHIMAAAKTPPTSRAKPMAGGISIDLSDLGL